MKPENRHKIPCSDISTGFIIHVVAIHTWSASAQWSLKVWLVKGVSNSPLFRYGPKLLRRLFCWGSNRGNKRQKFIVKLAVWADFSTSRWFALFSPLPLNQPIDLNWRLGGLTKSLNYFNSHFGFGAVRVVRVKTRRADNALLIDNQPPRYR